MLSHESISTSTFLASNLFDVGSLHSHRFVWCMFVLVLVRRILATLNHFQLVFFTYANFWHDAIQQTREKMD